MSPLLAPDRAEIERALDDLLRRDAGARVLAMRSPVRRAWPEAIERQGMRFRIAWCASELEIRERLVETETDSGGMVVLTPLDATALAGDIVARFPRARLEQLDRWSALRGLFKAHAVDPRLGAERWLADLLLAEVPPDGYRPAPGGVLDLDTAWLAALEDILGLPEGRGDAATLLRWTLDPLRLDRMLRLPRNVQTNLAGRLATTGGPAAAVVLGAVSSGRGGDALAIALAYGVVYGEAAPRAGLRDAAIRLEPLIGGASVDPDAGRSLAEAGRRVYDLLAREDAAAFRATEARCAALLNDIRAEQAAGLSPALELGLDARLREAAGALDRAAETLQADDAATAWERVRHAAGHDRADRNAARIVRLTMAARLVAWLARGRGGSARTFREAAFAYAEEGGYVDRAREALRGGDPLPEAAAAFSRISSAALTRREAENRAFAELLQGWNEGGGQGDMPLPVERVLAGVVAPLARVRPVLLLVLDGLSFPVWRALSETVGRLGWTELVPEDSSGPLVGVAALPSVTEVSRASLLCGRLTQGDQGVERAGFAAHQDLVAASRAGRPPRLFHKAGLAAGPELGGELHAALADPGQRVVGVIHNAVDAQLSGSDQLEITWTADVLRQVSAVLHAARQAGRVVIITGDHGHVTEAGTVQVPGGGGDRWRTETPPPADGEAAYRGGRVITPGGATSMVAAWSERVRYAARRGGYHGGAAPQEVLVPLAVLGAGDPPAGWAEAPPGGPAWWHGADPGVRTARGPEDAPPAARRRRTEARQEELFVAPPSPGDGAAPAPAGPRREEAGGAGPWWVEALQRTEAYASQRALAGRGAPPDDQIRALLMAVAARGGRITRTGLAQALGTPVLRLAGLVSAARRVLNLDQAQILVVDGDDIVLDEALLRLQYGLGSRR